MFTGLWDGKKDSQFYPIKMTKKGMGIWWPGFIQPSLSKQGKSQRKKPSLLF